MIKKMSNDKAAEATGDFILVLLLIFIAVVSGVCVQNNYFGGFRGTRKMI